MRRFLIQGFGSDFILECDPTVNYTQRDCEQYHLMYKILNKCDCYPR